MRRTASPVRRAQPGPALLLLSLLAATGAGAEETLDSGSELTLATALAIAFERSPVLAAARADVAAARARLTSARVYPYNPELGIGQGRREGAEGESTDRELALSLELEVAGQRGKRIAAARSGLAAAEAGWVRARRLLAAEVELSFAEGVAARELLALEAADVRLTEEFARYTRRRFRAGAATQIDLNLATATAGRASRRVALARAEYTLRRSRLGEVVGTLPGVQPRPLGDLLLPREAPPPLPRLLAAAQRNRADLEAFRHTRMAVQSELRLARAERFPNLVVGTFRAEEERTETIHGFGVGLALPLFNRNQGAVAETAAELTRTGADLRTAELAVAREVTAAWAGLRAAREAVQHLGTEVVGSLEENLRLLERAFEAGKLDATDLLAFRHELVEARREWIATLTDGWIARITLDLAIGATPTPPAAALRENDAAPTSRPPASRPKAQRQPEESTS